MKIFTPLEPLTGPGRDLPKETGADAAAGTGPEPKMFPKPKYVPTPKITYPFNKVTKYVDGSKIEFNTTPDNEYISLQNGDFSNRLTMFRRGNMEIRQLGPTFFHSVNQVKNKKQDTAAGDTNDPKSEINTYRGLHHTFVNDGLIFTESKSSVHTQKNKFKIINQITNFISKAKIKLTTRLLEIASKKVIIDTGIDNPGEVQIRGDLVVFGNIKYSGAFTGVIEKVDFRLEQLEETVKDLELKLEKERLQKQELEAAAKKEAFIQSLKDNPGEGTGV